MRLTKNIWRKEVACKCGCGFDTIDFETIQVVQECCNHFAAQIGVDKVSLHVNSAARCKDHNKAIGGSPKSQHVYGRAMDIVIDGIKPADVYEYLVTTYPDRYGIGNYASFTHIDTRSGVARW